ncbi:MAG: hypothetical protein ACYCST_00430 [Acidimicrobiales bacterium]
MADERSLSDLLWDYGVYAPIGLAVSIAEEIPRLSDKGKGRASGQISVARVIGKMAVEQGKRELEKRVNGTSRHDGAGRHPTQGASTAAGDAEQVVAASKARPQGDPPVPADNRAATGSPPRLVKEQGCPGGQVGSLAIPGYDTLAASQVVQRLSSLRPEELEDVRVYELSTRGRRTILHRISQLSSDPLPRCAP